jgi:hypothetical protein
MGLKPKWQGFDPCKDIESMQAISRNMKEIKNMRAPQYWKGYVAHGDGYTADESPSNSPSIVSQDFLEVSGINAMRDREPSFDESAAYFVHTVYNSSSGEDLDVVTAELLKNDKGNLRHPGCKEKCTQTMTEDNQCCCTTF